MENYKRLEIVRNRAELSFPQLAMKLGLKSPQVFYDIKKGKQGISKDLAEKISRIYPEFSMQWLLTGEAMPSEATQAEMRPHVLVGAAAGYNIEQYVSGGDIEMRPMIPWIPSYDYTFPVFGDSMLPEYHSGDIVAIRATSQFVQWGHVYLLDTEEGFYLKRVLDDGNAVQCLSYNSEYPPFSIPKTAIRAMYRVVGLIRTL